MNAVDFAGSLSSRGHDVTIFGPPGELDARIKEYGLAKVDAPRARIHPSPAVTSALCEHVHTQRAEIVHAFEWPPAIEALYGPYRRMRVPVLCTIMSMAVAPFLPKQLALTVGTREILRHETAAGRAATLLEPPVDTHSDRARDQRASKRSLGIAPGVFVVAVVSRLAEQLKLEGLLAAIRAVAEIDEESPGEMRLVIAGDGAARGIVDDAAAQVNTRAGREVVMVLGQRADPAPIYDSADVALGMGGSALRALAFSKPLIVQGELGFWRVFTPESETEFLKNGWYGVGTGSDGAPLLAEQLRMLRDDALLREQLGAHGRRLVEQYYALDRGAEILEALYADVVARNTPHTVPLVKAYGAVTGYELARKVRRRLGIVALDDFNTIARMRQSAPATTRFAPQNGE